MGWHERFQEDGKLESALGPFFLFFKTEALLGCEQYLCCGLIGIFLVHVEQFLQAFMVS